MRVITLSVLETLTTKRGESCILQRTDKEESAKRAAPRLLLAEAERWDELSSRKGEKRRNDARCARAQNGNPLGTRLHVAVFARRTDCMRDVRCFSDVKASTWDHNSTLILNI